MATDSDNMPFIPAMVRNRLGDSETLAQMVWPRAPRSEPGSLHSTRRVTV